MSAPAPRHLLRGDPRHGVNRYAREVATAAGCAWTVTDGDRDGGVEAETGESIHVHFTDRLWGTSPAEAAERISALAGRGPLSVTLHDLPQASDGPRSHLRRADGYARVAGRAAMIITNSHWERELLAAFSPRPATVIPLAVMRAATYTAAASDAGPSGSMASAPPTRPLIGLLGWVYPGKGHAEAIAAAATLARTGDPAPGVVALGAVSEGHSAEADELVALAAAHGVPFTITGYLTEADLARRASEVAVPLAAHQHVSASGSINSWLSLGRRPLVRDSPYAREMAHRRPGTLQLVTEADLAVAVRERLALPERGWLAPDVDLSPGLDAVAGAYRRTWSGPGHR